MRLDDELRRVFGHPPVAPRAVVHVQVGSGQGLDAGRDEADRLVDAGADLVVLDCPVPSTAALVAIAVILDLDAVGVVGTDAGTGAPDAWRERVVAVRDQLRVARRQPQDTQALAGDPLLGRVAGLLDRLATRRTPVLLGGGTAVAVAAVLARRLQPGADRWWLAGSAPEETAGRLALTSLGLTPLLDLGLGDGGAEVAVAVVRTRLEQLGA